MEYDFTVLNIVSQTIATVLVFCFVLFIAVIFVLVVRSLFYTNEDYRFSLEKYDFTVKIEYRSLNHLMHCIEYMEHNPYDIKANVGHFIIKHKSCTVNVFGMYNMNEYLKTCGKIDDIHNSISELGYKLERKIKEKIRSNDEGLYINEV